MTDAANKNSHEESTDMTRPLTHRHIHAQASTTDTLTTDSTQTDPKRCLSRVLSITAAGLLGATGMLAGAAITNGTAYADGSGNTVTTSAPSTTFGQNITFTDTIAPASPGSPTPTGLVVFYLGYPGGGGANGAEVPAYGVGYGFLNSAGQASVSTTLVLPGTWDVIAEYYGDAVNPPSVSSDTTQTVTPATPQVSVSDGYASVPLYTAFTVSVSAPVAGDPVPTGTVTLEESWPSTPYVSPAGSTVLYTGSLNNGQLRFSTKSLHQGTLDTITAIYSGDGDYASAASAPVQTRAIQYGPQGF